MRRTLIAIALLAAVTLPVHAQGTTPLATGEGMLPVDGGRIWYRVTGTGHGLPVVLLHGGPGFSSYYLKSLEQLGDDRPVVRYDQLGGGKSDAFTDTTRMTVDHFVRELEALRVRLGAAKMHLFGHSWGTILAVEYQRAHPDRVASLALGGAALDIAAWERHARELEKTLPDSLQQAITRAEAAHEYTGAAYQSAIAEFYSRYVWRHPVPADLDSLTSTANMTIYNFMEGPSEFTITGTLKGYDFTPHLSEIHVPVLYPTGEFDEAGLDNVRRFASLTKGARVAVIPDAAHIATWDNPGETVRVVREFLRHADAGRAAR